MLYITATMKNVNSLDAYLVRKNVDFQKKGPKAKTQDFFEFHDYIPQFCS